MSTTLEIQKDPPLDPARFAQAVRALAQGAHQFRRTPSASVRHRLARCVCA